MVQLHHARGSDTLESVVCNALGLKPEQLNWDSSHIDGQWVIRVNGPGNQEQAEWTYEPAGKTVNPVNPAARTLMGLEATREMLTGSSRESTIIVDTASGQVTSRFESTTIQSNARSETGLDSPAPVRLSAVPELFDVNDSEDFIEISLPDQIVSEPAKPAVKKAKKGRAKVPSWDEILFGANSTDD